MSDNLPIKTIHYIINLLIILYKYFINALDCISISSYTIFFVAPYPIDVTSIEGEKTNDDNVRIMWEVNKHV